MRNTRLLIVEDEVAEIDTWRKQIERNNAKKERNDTADYASSFESAKTFLQNRKYDAAIVDIRLENEEGTKGANASGNDVRDLILSTEIVLIAHLTGETNAVKQPDNHYKDLVRVFEKASADESEKPVHEEILDWLEAKIDIISAMRVVKSNISSKMAELFYLSIWPRWDSWHKAEIENEEFVSSSITRHITSHLYSSFLEAGGGKVHPEEWYFQPPNSDRFHTGDLIKHHIDYYVLVTPRCDLERLGPNDTLLMAKLEIAKDWEADKQKLDIKLNTLKAELVASDDEEQNESKNKKIDNVLNDFRRKYYGHKNEKAGFHFLPEINISQNESHGPFFVDFSNIKPVVVSSEEAAEFQRGKIAGLSPEFVPALVQRLGTYISRIGSPDYSHFS